METRVKVVFMKAGEEYSATKAYRLHDYVVIDGVTVYACKKVDAATMTCVGHPLTDTEYWDKFLDMEELKASLESAADAAVKKADTATTNANAATKSATDAASAANTAKANADKATTAANTAASAANTAKTNADTATSKANAAAAGAEKVNATITADNVLKVTDRTGAEKTLALQSQADATETAKTVAELKTKVDTFVNTSGYVGMARMNGDASGDAEVSYGTKEKIHEMGGKFRLCTVKNGKITHRLAPCRLTLDENGNEVKIDGSDGDILLCMEDGTNMLRDTKTVDEREMNIIGLGNNPCSWYGSESKRLPPFGITPCDTVNAKILDDERSQAHCVYNTSAMGGANNNERTKILKASYIKTAGGYPSQGISSILAIQYAQNKNSDPLTNRPYMGCHYEFYEALITMLYSEIGSLRHTDRNMFGIGCTDSGITETTFATLDGTSGWCYVLADGTRKYVSLWNAVKPAGSTNNMNTIVGVCGNAYYTFTEMLEPQRLIDGIVKAGLVGMTNDKNNLFCYNEDGSVSCISDGSVNLNTGEGMELLKKYYILRDVPKCEGMKDGVMTAVVNSFVKMEFADGCKMTNGTDLTGGYAILKLSQPVYRGYTLPYVSKFRQIHNAYYVVRVDAEGKQKMEFRCAPDVEKVPPMTTFGNDAFTMKGMNNEPPMLRGLTEKYEYATLPGNEAGVASSRYGLSLFCMNKQGGNLTSYENAYLWLYPTNNGGKDSVQVHGSVSGCSANAGGASVRTAVCNRRAGDGYNFYAGAFAVLLNQ